MVRLQPLQFAIHLIQHRRIEQLGQIDLPQELAQQGTIERENRGAALSDRYVRLVHELRYIAEQQVGREG
ncbi:hypothetical protein D3C71_2073850 [compost metagenome]